MYVLSELIRLKQMEELIRIVYNHIVLRFIEYLAGSWRNYYHLFNGMGIFGEATIIFSIRTSI